MTLKTVCLFIFLLSYVCSKYVRDRRPRSIDGTYTSYETSTQLVTSIVPSSCVSVDPTLQPCRSVRYLSFPNYFGSWSNIFNRTIQTKSREIETTALGWGEYFGIYAPTVTVTEIQLQTTFVKDPRVVVTYAVKGCRPHHLPNDIDRCELPETISIQEIIPTSTVTVLQSSSTSTTLQGMNYTNTKPFPSHNAIQVDSSKNNTNKILTMIEASSEFSENENDNTKLPTKPLPF